MSVINKMLRDLDQRNHSAANVNQVIARRPGQPLWLTVLLLLTFGLLCFAIYAVLSRSTVMPPATLTAAVPEPAAQLPEKPAEIAIAAHSLEPKDSLEPTKSPEPTKSLESKDSLEPTDSPAPTPGPALTQSTIAKPSPVPEQTATPEDTGAADAAEIAAQPEPQQIKPGVLTAQVDAVPQAATVVQAPTPAPTAKTGSSLSVTSREPTAAQSQAKLRQQAMAAAQAGQLQQALQLWQQLQQFAPQNAVAYLEQARLWHQLGQPQQALTVLQQALQQGIVHADIQLLLAQQAAAQAQWQRVDTLLPAQFALAQQPEYYGLKATALQQLGQPQAALDWFSQLIVLQPQQARWWLGAAIAYDQSGQTEQAVLHYRQALQWGDSLTVASRNYIQQRLAAIE